jgi:hypothetical protein
MWQGLDDEEPAHFTYTPYIDIANAFVPTERRPILLLMLR